MFVGMRCDREALNRVVAVVDDSIVLQVNWMWGCPIPENLQSQQLSHPSVRFWKTCP